MCQQHNDNKSDNVRNRIKYRETELLAHTTSKPMKVCTLNIVTISCIYI